MVHYFRIEGIPTEQGEIAQDMQYIKYLTQNTPPQKVDGGKKKFKGYKWNRIPRSDRLLLGTFFLHHVNQQMTNIKEIQKTTSGNRNTRLEK